MIEEFAYDMASGDDAVMVAEKNKRTEERIKKIVDEALSKHHKAFQENDVTYELRFFQGKAELEFINLEQGSDLGLEVSNSLIGIGTLIGQSEH